MFLSQRHQRFPPRLREGEWGKEACRAPPNCPCTCCPNVDDGKLACHSRCCSRQGGALLVCVHIAVVTAAHHCHRLLPTIHVVRERANCHHWDGNHWNQQQSPWSRSRETEGETGNIDLPLGNISIPHWLPKGISVAWSAEQGWTKNMRINLDKRVARKVLDGWIQRASLAVCAISTKRVCHYTLRGVVKSCS